MATGRPPLWLLQTLAVGILLCPTSTFVRAQTLTRVGRELTDVAGEVENLKRVRIARTRSAMRSDTYVEERLSDGELFYRLQDYVRASIILTDIVDHHEGHRAFPDGLFLLGDSLYRAGDYYGARSRFRQFLSHAGEVRFQPYVQRVLGRLIEIAIHTRDFDGVEEYFAELSQLPPTEVEAVTTYYRAKYLFNRAVPPDDAIRGDHLSEGVDLAGLESAREAFMAVPEGSPYHAQSRYFVGVIHIFKGELPQAVEAFERVLRTPTSSLESRRVVELAQLALGRLFYELDRIEKAIEAYQSIPRSSPNFDEALYEIAWAYIRLGDSTRAERALEVLTVAAPGSRYIPDGKLLRAGLLLRNGRLHDAEEVYQEVRVQFQPVRDELNAMVAGQEDPRLHFREMVRSNLQLFDVEEFLPPLARRWATFEEDMNRALTLLSDTSKVRQLVTETSGLISRLDGAINSPNAVNVFPDLRRQRERTVALRTRLSKAQQQLISLAGNGVAGSGELGRVRAKRQRLEASLATMPVARDQFDERNEVLLSRYRRLQRELGQLEIVLLGMEAQVVATERFVEDSLGHGSVTEEDVQAVRESLALQRGALEHFQGRVTELRRAVEVGRLQVGVGDIRYQKDAQTREEHRQLVAQERELVRSRGQIPANVDVTFDRVDSLQQSLDEYDQFINDVVSERTQTMRVVLEDESERLSVYTEALHALEQEAEDVATYVTYNSFNRVRKRFYDLVLKADVGEIDVSWARREEHRQRVESLNRERSGELQALQDEYQEIMDLQSGGGE